MERCLYGYAYYIYIEKCLLIVGVAAAAFLICSLSPNSVLVNGSSYTDSSVFQYIGREILNGRIPYRDTFDHKGPIVYLINALGMVISKNNGIWYLEIINHFFTMWFMMKTAQLVGVNEKRAFGIVVIISSLLYKYFEGGSLVEEYAMLYIALGLWVFSDYFINGKTTVYKLAVCSGSLAAVFMLRMNMISLWLVMSFGVLLKCMKDEEEFRRLCSNVITIVLNFVASKLVIFQKK